jgi:tRNA (cytidine/uridine-2'-O-)-methyltransferase
MALHRELPAGVVAGRVRFAEPLFHVVLVHPEIPPNTGNIGRMCLGMGARLHLVGPIGFSTSEKAVRRAGLDYWKHVDVVEHADLDCFHVWAGGRRRLLFSGHGGIPYTRLCHARGDVLVFGRESIGLPSWLLEHDGAFSIPMPGAVRSLNLSNAVGIVAAHVLRQLRPELF